VFDIESLWIEAAACPGKIALMFLVPRIPDGGKKFAVPVRSTTVLRRTCAFPFQADRDGVGDLLGWKFLLGLEEVLPAVAEVVLVDARCPSPRQDLVEGDAAMVNRSGLVLQRRLPETHLTNFELMQVRVAPTHRGLDDRVQAR
jgi:hypothetical protein